MITIETFLLVLIVYTLSLTTFYFIYELNFIIVVSTINCVDSTHTSFSGKTRNNNYVRYHAVNFIKKGF